MPTAKRPTKPDTTKRKRRRRARTEVSSSESSSDSSSDSSSESEAEDVKEAEDVVMDDADLSDSESEDEKTEEERTKTKRMPSPLRDLHDPRPFEEYYMKLVTEEFGDDLDAVRKAKDFEEGGVRSLGMLVRALESGVNVFDEDEMRSVVVANGK